MSIGGSIFLIAVGAILAFGLAKGVIPSVDQTLWGYGLIGVGVLGVTASLILAGRGRRRGGAEPDEHRDDLHRGKAVVGLQPTLRGFRGGR